MREPIDLITHEAVRTLRRFTRRTQQPTSLDLVDTAPMEHVHSIEITEEHVTLQYEHVTRFRYNANEISYREWSYKYNDDAEFVDAIAKVIELARRHRFDMPENVACPPGCANCCSGYEPFVSGADVDRIAAHLKLSREETLARYVVERPSADGFVVGYLRKVTDELASACVFLKGKESGEHYCGIYDGRPHDCRAFTPIGCQDVDTELPRTGAYPIGPPFRPRRTSATTSRRPRR